MSTKSFVRMITTLEGFKVVKEFVNKKVKEYPYHHVSTFMDDFDEIIVSEKDNYVIFGWNRIKFNEELPDVKAIYESLNFLEESNIPYRYGEIDESDDDTDYAKSFNAKKLPGLYTIKEFEYDIEQKNSFLVVVKNSFIRSMQIAPNEYIGDFYNDNFDNSYDWSYVEDGELTIGIYDGNSEEEVLENAAEIYNIDKRALKAYELK